jgi:hypothetical protein
MPAACVPDLYWSHLEPGTWNPVVAAALTHDYVPNANANATRTPKTSATDSPRSHAAGED